MSRRSSRLLSGGYYNSEDDSDSSSVTNISYRENAVKVFKKKAGPRKAASRTPSRAVSDASSLDPEPLASAGQYKGLSPSQLSQTEPTMRTVPYVSTGVTPRPPLTPRTPLTPRPPLTTPASRDQTPAPRPSAPPERSLNARLRVASQVALHLQPNHKELSQSGVDSSGYSSSEGPRRKPPDPSSTSGAPSTGYWDRISCAVFNLMYSVSLMAAALQKHFKHLTASAGGRMMKACRLLFLLLIALLCVWLLLPFLTFLVTRLAVATPESQPVLPAATLPLPPPQRDAVHPVVDPAVVSAAVEERIRHVLAEQQLKQQHLLSQVSERLQLDLQDMKEQLQLDLQDMKAQLAAVDLDERLRLERELSGLGEQMVDYRSAAAVLGLRIQDLEAQNAKLSQEWSSIQLMPPHNPSPETSNPPVQNQLTPELQQALEKWLTDRIKQEAVRLADGGSCSACVRPVADKMADFALETQGASVVSTRCSETYRTRSACVTLFGFPLWYPSESPRTVIQGYPVMLPGKCWAFHGVQGTLVISLSHPITLTHVTLDHLPRYNSPTGRIDSAPKDFEVYGMKDEVEEGTLLGSFRYDEDGEPTQTFRLPNPSGEVHRSVELRVLTNWGHVEYTCLYRFRVHGEIAAAR